MSPPLSIVIKEENHYLAVGIKHALLQHFSAHPVQVKVNNEGDSGSCDIAILSTKHLGAVCPTTQRFQLIVLSASNNIRAKLLYEHGVFCHHQSIEKLLVMIELRLKSLQDKQQSPSRKKIFSKEHSPRLTPRQQEVIELFSQGLSIQEIAELLHISNKSVSYTKRRVMSKLDLQNLAQLHRWIHS
ncbi:LuxR C-terminal-related transcriptional regulator [Enterobacter sp. CC120223-11]|uniref:helix-turn-helix transcriptional regulator n=1 Tax=Enterobacter sp. CC120223-11 TaxID=1378073 RepID=UPI000BDA5F48|nr:LuxR C-terminal-related transcriptional regulator [Enterobacter sp. CC120223-11]SNY75341.1 regulatory protein, luxR family [Enterobacter sp. CC120223-11]